MFKTIVDHSVFPPVSYSALSGECVRIGDKIVPIDNPPKEHSIFPAGPDEAVPTDKKLAGWTQEVKDGVSVKVPILEELIPEPTQEEKLIAEAQQILTDPDHGKDAVESIQGVIACVQRVAALGVQIEDWSFEGVTAAAQLANSKTEELAAKFEILQASLALRVAWDRWVYHTTSMYLANHLWPYAYDIVTKGELDKG